MSKNLNLHKFFADFSKRNNLKYCEIAKSLGMSYQRFHNIKGGFRKPSFDFLERFTAVFKLTDDEITALRQYLAEAIQYYNENFAQKYRETQKRWVAKNPQRVREYNREYYKLCKEVDKLIEPKLYSKDNLC